MLYLLIYRLDSLIMAGQSTHATSINDYVLQETIGEGRFSQVKLARRKSSGLKVAVKIQKLDKHTKEENGVNQMIQGGKYSPPSYLSSGATDLIQRILVVDPGKRITIP